MSSIGEVCGSLGQTLLTSLVGYRWATATGGPRVTLTPDYDVSFVPARGEYNIANHTKGKLCNAVHLNSQTVRGRELKF